jgi:hypothetical protein
MARGEQILAIDVLGKGPGLADQRVDDVPVIDGVLARTRQPRHALDHDARMPHLHLLDADHHLHLPADQPAGDRVRVPQDLDRAARPYRNLRHPPTGFQPMGRKRTQHGHFFRQPLLPVRIPRGHEFLKEPLVLFPAGEVAAATQPQGLIHRLLEVPVRRFGVAVLVRLADVDPLSLQAVVRQEVLITLAKLPFFGEVVHCRRETVAAVPSRNSSQFPQRVLQALAQSLEGLRRAERNRLPVRVRQREVERQVGERLAGQRHFQAVHVREIGGRQVSRMMDLSEHHRLVRALESPPRTDPSLEGSTLTVGELPPVLLLQPMKQRDRLQGGILVQQFRDRRPDLLKRIRPRPPMPWSDLLGRQFSCLPILPCRLFVHARHPCRKGQPFPRAQQAKQLSYLTVLDHRNLLIDRKLRL